MKTENRKERKRRFNGSLELRTVRGRDRERETQKKLYFKNALTQCSIHVCVQCTRFIQVLTRTDRSTIVLQCSLRAPTLTPKYIPSGISSFASFASFGSLCRTGISDRSQPTRYSVLGLTDRSPPTRYSASSADSADVELVSQQVYTPLRSRFTHPIYALVYAPVYAPNVELVSQQ